MWAGPAPTPTPTPAPTPTNLLLQTKVRLVQIPQHHFYSLHQDSVEQAELLQLFADPLPSSVHAGPPDEAMDCHFAVALEQFDQQERPHKPRAPRQEHVSVVRQKARLAAQQGDALVQVHVVGHAHRSRGEHLAEEGRGGEGREGRVARGIVNAAR